MKRNGFTLIELLAVIVILAIIALIATPIILGIINDARKESQERSVELYASAIRNGIAAYQLREMKEVQAGTYTSETLPFDVEYDGEVECATIELYEDGGVYVADCTVNGIEVEYTYGTQQTACTLEDRDGDGIASLSDIVTCGTENFYVMKNQNSEITMLSMYNLYVGYNQDANSYSDSPVENPTNKQSELAKGYIEGNPIWYATVSLTSYWSKEIEGDMILLPQYGDSYPVWVYNENSSLYEYVSEYERILKEEIGVSTARATLISYEQLEDLKCSGDNWNCKNAPVWVYSTSYWTGTAYDSKWLWNVGTDGHFSDGECGPECGNNGVRPVIIISESEI